MKSVVIIPARYKSSRLGKPLVEIARQTYDIMGLRIKC